MTRFRPCLLLAVIPSISSCLFFQCAPDSCREAVEGRALFAPLIAAIEDYRQHSTSYPETLDDLVPDFIEAIPVSEVEDGPVHPEYRRSDDSDEFRFSFQYFGPGMNRCTYTPRDAWGCDGHF